MPNKNKQAGGKSPEPLKIETVDVASLIADPSNVRKHSQKNLDAIKGSLTKFGAQKPIVVDAKGVVIAGNGTLEAAKSLGWKTIPIVRTNLTGVDATAFAIADNRTGELAEWDAGGLSDVLKTLRELDFDLESIGFDTKDLDIMAATEVPEGLTDEDAVPEVTDTRCKPGDLWTLGNHRLLCGDSTNVQHVERLMGGDKADMVFTDPPYNIAYEGGSKKREVIKNDSLGVNFYDFLLQVFSNLQMNTLPGAALYVSHADTERVSFTKAYVDAGFHLSSVIIWAKNNATFGRQDYFWKHEPILYGWNASGPHSWHGPNNEETIWSIDRPSRSEEHPTMKPIELMERALRNSSLSGQKVLDIFLGSGSTLIACEKTGRKCYGMEIDPHYCDVILKRWEDFTGKKATLEKQSVS
jgi:DNA modification methylase